MFIDKIADYFNSASGFNSQADAQDALEKVQAFFNALDKDGKFETAGSVVNGPFNWKYTFTAKRAV